MYTDKEIEFIRSTRKEYQIKWLEEIIKQFIKESLDEFLQEIAKREESNQPLLTIEDIARKFQVTKATIHNWMKKGSIVGKKFGKNRYFTEDEVRKSMAKYGFTKQWEDN